MTNTAVSIPSISSFLGMINCDVVLHHKRQTMIISKKSRWILREEKIVTTRQRNNTAKIFTRTGPFHSQKDSKSM